MAHVRRGGAGVVPDRENGGTLEYRGLFLLVERVDDVFLEDRFPARAKGNLYDVAVPNASVGATLERREGGPAAYARLFPLSDGRLPEATYTLDTNNEDDDPAELKTYGDLAAFIDTLNGETPALSNLGEGRFASDAYARELDAIFNTRGFLRWAAINTLAGSWDNYLCTPGNYRLYNAGRGDTGDFMKAPYFYWVPWDYDNSLGVNYFAGADWATVPLLRPWEACGPYWQSVGGGPTPAPVPVLLANMLQNPTYRGYYLAFVEHALATWFHADWVAQRVGPDTVAGDSAAGLWSILRPSVYGETLGAGTEAPFTQRLWTNDEIFRHLFRSERLQRPSEGRDVQSLTNFMNRRATRAREELAGLPPPPAVDFRSVRVEAPPG